jgi:hypothetical protein
MGRNRRAFREEEEHSNACHGNHTSRTVTITAMFLVFINIATEHVNGGTIQWNLLILMITVQQQLHPTQSMRHFLRWCFYSFVSDLCRHYLKYRSLWHGSCRHVSKISAQNACLLDLGYPYLHCATMEFLSQKLIFVNILSVFVRR